MLVERRGAGPKLIHDVDGRIHVISHWAEIGVDMLAIGALGALDVAIMVRKLALPRLSILVGAAPLPTGGNFDGDVEPADADMAHLEVASLALGIGRIRKVVGWRSGRLVGGGGDGRRPIIGTKLRSRNAPGSGLAGRLRRRRYRRTPLGNADEPALNGDDIEVLEPLAGLPDCDLDRLLSLERLPIGALDRQCRLRLSGTTCNSHTFRTAGTSSSGTGIAVFCDCDDSLRRPLASELLISCVERRSRIACGIDIIT